MWWGWKFNPLPNTTPTFPLSLMGPIPSSPSPELEALKLQGVFPENLGFSGSLKMNGLETV